MIATALIRETGDALSPIYYMIAAALLAVLALWRSPDRSRSPLL